MHSPFHRIVPGATDAVLFIHGIVSTPRFFDAFLPSIPEGFSVHSLLLPGHGGSVQDFGRHGAKEWQSHVRASLEELRASHERVYIAAHSLGTLLAILEAADNPERIAGMLLLCVPLRIWAKPAALVHNALKGVGLAENTAQLHTYYGTEQDWRVWRYIRWIPRYAELFIISARARRALAGLAVPCRVFMAEKDELVSLRGVKDLQRCAAADIRYLPLSHHHEFPPEDQALLLDALQEMLAATR